MTRGRIDQLDWPKKRFRVDRVEARPGEAGFETEQASEAWDRRRAANLRKATLDPEMQKSALQLADRLEAKDPPRSRASSRYMRDQRIRILGAVWQLIEEAGA